MAFVFRTLDKQNSPMSRVPGPGAYFKPKKNIQSHQTQHRVPFNHSENRQIWKMPNVPGPGAYDSQDIMKKQKKLVSDAMGHCIIYQTPSESVAFKSKTIRFTTNSNSNNPGPGEYQTEPEILRPQSAFKKPQIPSSQLKQFLKQKNNHFKSTDEENKNIKDMIVWAKDDFYSESFMEPKKAEVQNKKESKKSIFFTSKVQRNINRIRPQTSAGPGSYNIVKSVFEIQKKYTKKYPLKSICIDKRVQQVETQEVGPGYYELDQAFKNLNQSNSVKKKKLQCFGSTVDRFQLFKSDSHIINPGPATYYQLSQSVGKLKKPKTAGALFPKEQRKIFEPPQSAILPISYHGIQDFCSVKKQNYQRKSTAKECFGSTKQRFQEKTFQKMESTNACSSQNVNLIVSKPKYNTVEDNKLKQTQFYRTLLNTRQKKKRFEEKISMNQPKLEISPVIDRPLCYDNQTHTFASKFGQKFQKDAPFMSGAQRFKDRNSQKFINLELNDPKNITKGKKQRLPHERMTSRLSKKRGSDGKMGWIAVSKDQRFKYTAINQIIGPQYYDPLLPENRSHNVLFAGTK